MRRSIVRSILAVGALASTASTALAGTAVDGFGPPTAWSKVTFYGELNPYTTQLADVNGDGLADAVAFDGNSTWVMTSNQSSFNPPTEWSSSGFSGESTDITNGTQLADVNGDGKADAVAFDANSTWVMLSNGSAFGAPTAWSRVTFYGEFNTFSTVLGDVNGDGKADAVAFDGNSTWVMLSNGSAFGAPTAWSSVTFNGQLGAAQLANPTQLADVNGDGKADAVAFDGSSTWVMLSNGSAFGTPTQWSNNSFYGQLNAHTTQLADVNGDGKADAVAFDGNSTWVMLSTGGGFGPPVEWSGLSFYGESSDIANGTQLADVNGDHKADAVAFDANSTWIMLSIVQSTAPTLTVALDPQLESEWCWAASGEMVMGYLGTSVQQCSEANYHFSRTDCCTNPSETACNQPGWPDWNHWGFNYSETANGSALSFSQLQSEFAANRPVGFAWEWSGGGGHYMVATGAEVDADDVQYVTINDPWAPNVGEQVTLTYEDWVSGPAGTDATANVSYTHIHDDYGIAKN